MNPAKLHKSMSVTMVADPDPDELVPVILKLRRGAVAHGDLRILTDVPEADRFTLLNARAARVTPKDIAALTDDPSVEMIWPDLPVHTWLDEAVPEIEAPRVWETGFTGRGVRIAILDTGIDADHPDFTDRVIAWRDLIDPAGEGANSPRDPNGHGTHVSGIAAGSGVSSNGRYRGVAPEAELIVGRVLDAAGGGRTSTVMAGIEWAIGNGARIVNISLGGPPYPADGDDALSMLCNAAVDHGVVVCVAAGNLGPAGHTIGAPAAARKVITIGASQDRGRTTRVAAFSSRGPTGDGRTKPDLLFPGMAVVATRASGTALGAVIDQSYTALRGTSQATPMAAGAAALLLQANPALGPAEVKERLVRGARRLHGAAEVAQGAGRGDVYNGFIGSSGAPLVPSAAPPATPVPGPTPPSQPSLPPVDGIQPPAAGTRSGCLPGGSLLGAMRKEG